MSDCLICHRPIEPKEGPGRPNVYCSPACRRTAEHEVRRLDRRLERLEEQRDDLRGEVLQYQGTGMMRFYGPALAACEANIVTATERMRVLLAGDDRDQ